MKLLSIIAEYNPFHNGHAYHLDISKQKSGCTHSMAIMSGNFLQRGEPALLDKWTRAKGAVQCGLDLVIELPFVYSCQSAEIFAFGSILTLDALHIVDTLSFGCEDDDLGALSQIAKILVDEPIHYKKKLKQYLDEGHSYPKARQFSINDYMDSQSEIINSPNNILAIEYLKWLYQFGSKIRPLPIKRRNAGYHDANVVNNFAGATYIRNSIKNSNNPESILGLVPDVTYDHLMRYSQNTPFNHLDNYFSLIIGDLLKSSPQDVSEIFDVNEGLENRILHAVSHSKTMEELIDNIASKRYTKTRIKRILINFLHDHKRVFVNQTFKNSQYTPYVRVLAFNDRGKEILKKIKSNSDIKIITNLPKEYDSLDPIQRYVINKDILSTNYFYLLSNLDKMNSDFLKKPEII